MTVGAAPWAARLLDELGLPTDLPTQVSSAGSVNLTFVVGSGPDGCVIRTPKDRRSTDVFDAEQWCAAQAGLVGVPTPPILFVGTFDGRPYSVQTLIEGRRGTDVRRQGLWPDLGDYCARINEIQPEADAPPSLFMRFSRDLLSAWVAHLDYNFSQLNEQDPLLERGFFTRSEQLIVRDVVHHLRDVPQRFGLSHGDPSPRNLVVPIGAPPVIIDWGSASFGPVPWADLLVLDRDRRKSGTPSMRSMVQFARAAGVDLVSEWSVFTRYRLLQHVDLVRWAIERRPERIPDTVASLREVLGDHASPTGAAQ